MVMMIMMSCLTLVRHWHDHVVQISIYSHVGIVFSRGMGLQDGGQTFTSTMVHVVGWERSNYVFALLLCEEEVERCVGLF